jgi:alanine racemase
MISQSKKKTKTVYIISCVKQNKNEKVDFYALSTYLEAKEQVDNLNKMEQNKEKEWKFHSILLYE